MGLALTKFLVLEKSYMGFCSVLGILNAYK